MSIRVRIEENGFLSAAHQSDALADFNEESFEATQPFYMACVNYLRHGSRWGNANVIQFLFCCQYQEPAGIIRPAPGGNS